DGIRDGHVTGVQTCALPIFDISTSLTSTGAINVITKSGTNSFHGGGFYDFYNQDLGARLQYNPDAEPFNRKRFGVSLGGPIVKEIGRASCRERVWVRVWDGL